MTRTIQFLRLVPLYLLYLTTFGLAALSKWAGGGVPDWFEQQFSATMLNPFPGALAANFYFIALLESCVTLGFLTSLARGEFRPGQDRPWLLGSLLLAEVVFVMLGFGQRLTGNFTPAAELFAYCVLTLVAFWFVDSTRESRA